MVVRCERGAQTWNQMREREWLGSKDHQPDNNVFPSQTQTAVTRCLSVTAFEEGIAVPVSSFLSVFLTAAPGPGHGHRSNSFPFLTASPLPAMDPILPLVSSPVSPFLYEMTEDSAASSPKQICRRPNRSAVRLRVSESSVNVLTPVSAMNRSQTATLSALQPLSGFTGRISFGENQSENRHPPDGSPMIVSPVPRSGHAHLPEGSGFPECKVKDAVSMSELQPNLIGDFTSCHALPLISGQHQDLKTISSHTLASLIRGEFTDTVQDHIVVDCRYPYEYEGGHIVGAVNIYTREGLLDKFFNENTNADTRNAKRTVIIFHCEFSSKRGPKLYRFTRSQDRQHNAVNYPHLSYPELYILEGGYKAFYESYRLLCVPDSYLPMEADKTALRQFQSLRSKSWAKGGGNRNGGCQRGYKRTTLAIRNFD